MAVCALSGATALAQLPRPATGYLGTSGLRDWARTSKFSRVLTVDSGGRGDYTSISTALAAAAALSPAPSLAARATVLVYPGNAPISGFSAYSEATVAVPDYVTLLGIVPASSGAGAFNGNVTVALTSTSGTQVSVGVSSVIAHLDFYGSAALTGATTLLGKTSTGNSTVIDSTLYGSGLAGDSYALDLASCSGSGALYLENVALLRLGTATLTRHLVSACAAGISHYRGRMNPGESQAVLVETTGSGVLKLWSSRIDEGATCDLKAAGAGSISAYSTEYHSACGAGSVSNAETFEHAFASPPSGACPSGMKGYDGSYVYICVASGWRKIAHAAP
jgi:hypothetical protein